MFLTVLDIGLHIHIQYNVAHVMFNLSCQLFVRITHVVNTVILPL